MPVSGGGITMTLCGRVVAPESNTAERFFDPQWPWRETGTWQTSDGNRVNLTFNESRLNVNDNWNDDADDRVWASAARHFLFSFIPLGGGGYLLPI